MAIHEDGRVHAFQDKPGRPRPLQNDANHVLVSMGIYVFACDVLCSVLEDDAIDKHSSHDFDKDILPRMIHTDAVYGYQFGGDCGRVSADGYWRDVRTIDAYYAANMDLLAPEPPIDLYQANWPIHTANCQSPPARVIPGSSGKHNTLIDNAILGAGTVVAGGIVTNSILSRKVRVEEGAAVTDSILFDDVKVGAGVKLKRCIVDKQVQIPTGEKIGFDSYRDAQRFVISDGGIVVVPRDYRFNSLVVPEKPQRSFDPPISIGERFTA